MKKIEWTEKELILINEVIQEYSFDVNNEKDYDVSVKAYIKDHELVILLNPEDPKELYYFVNKIYRNSKGEIIDEETIESVKRPRLPKYLKTMLQRMIQFDNRMFNR